MASTCAVTVACKAVDLNNLKSASFSYCE